MSKRGPKRVHRVMGAQPLRPIRVEEKPGRNDPCPCGLDKKFKHCHGREPSSFEHPLRAQDPPTA